MAYFESEREKFANLKKLFVDVLIVEGGVEVNAGIDDKAVN